MKWALLACALCAIPSTSRAQATPLIVVSPTGCPSIGEIQAALGAEVAVIESSTPPTPEVRALIGVAEVTTSEEGSYRVRVELPGQPPLERTLPRADCATAARLVAIVVRGVDFRASWSAAVAPEATAPISEPRSIDSGSIDSGSIDSGSIDSGPIDSGPTDSGSIDAGPTDSTEVHWNLGIATGLGLEIAPTDGAWTEQLDLGLAYRALIARVVLIAATPTHVAVQTRWVDPLERIGFGARFDLGASIVLNETFSVGGRLGIGVLVASLASPSFAPTQFFRTTPTIGMQLFGEARLTEALFAFLELGLDVPLLRDTYALGGLPIGDSPATLLRLVVGIRVFFP